MRQLISIIILSSTIWNIIISTQKNYAYEAALYKVKKMYVDRFEAINSKAISELKNFDGNISSNS